MWSRLAITSTGSARTPLSRILARGAAATSIWRSLAARKWFEHPFAEFLYFEENRPPAVSQKNLERFSADCPPWLHSMTDPLSPDDARQYLTILYRLLYPHPGEMPTETKSTKAATGPPAAPRPAAKKAGNPGPI